MNKITIRTPIWSGRKVGLAEDKLGKVLTEVEITYRTKDGELLYPINHVITREEAMQYPVEITKGVRLRIVPIDKMDKIFTIGKAKTHHQERVK